MLDILDQYSEVVNNRRRMTPEWYSWFQRLAAASAPESTQFPTIAAAQSANLSDQDVVNTYGYYALGDDGGGTYVKVSSASNGGFQAADGSYWQLINNPINILSLGALNDNSTNTTPYYNSALALCVERAGLGVGQEIVFPNGQYKFSTLPNGIPSGVRLRSATYHGAYLNVEFAMSSNTAFLYNATGANAVEIKDFIIQSGSSNSNGFAVLLYADATDAGGGFSRLSGLYITGTGTWQKGVYALGTDKTSGAIGLRDLTLYDLKVFQCTEEHYRLAGVQACNATSIFGVPTGSVPANGSIVLTGTGSVPSQDVILQVTQASSINIDNSTAILLSVATMNDGGAGDSKTLTIASSVGYGLAVCRGEAAVVNGSSTFDVEGTDISWPNGRIINSPTVNFSDDIIADSITTNDTDFLHKTSAGLTDGAGGGAGTLTNAPTAGDPTKWVAIDDNGTTRYIPTWT